MVFEKALRQNCARGITFTDENFAGQSLVRKNFGRGGEFFQLPVCTVRGPPYRFNENFATQSPAPRSLAKGSNEKLMYGPGHVSIAPTGQRNKNSGGN